MKINLDLSGVTAEKAGMDVLTEGVHLFKIVDAEIKENNKKTVYYLMLTSVVAEVIDA